MARDEQTCEQFSTRAMDERSNFDVVEFTLTQKFEFMRYLTENAPQLRPKPSDRGAFVAPEEINLLLPAFESAMAATTNAEFRCVLNSARDKAVASRNAGRPIWIFR